MFFSPVHFFSAALGKYKIFEGVPPQNIIFLLTVGIFFFFLPLRTDATATIILMTTAALWCRLTKKSARCLLAGVRGVPLLAFIVFTLIASLAAFANPATLPKFPRFLLWGCCVFSGAMLSYHWPNHKNAYLWATTVALVGSLFIAVAFWGYDAPRFWHVDRLKLFAIHPSRFALYCAVCFFFLLHRSIEGKGFGRLVVVAAMLLILFLLVKTNTRGNLFMLPIGLLCMGLTVPLRFRKTFACFILLCVALGSGIFWAARDTAPIARLISAVTSLPSDPTFISRLPIWEAGWDAFKKAPLLGHGAQSYKELHRNYISKYKADWDSRYQGQYEMEVKQAHNIVLGRLVETGFLGAFFFMLFYWGAVLQAWRGRQEVRWVVAPLVFYFAMSMLDDGLFRMNDAFILFIAGTALGYEKQQGGSSG